MVLAVTLAVFALLSAVALREVGYWGIIAPHFRSVGAAQVLVDLCIALAIVMSWIWRDARAAGRNPWPWLAATVVTGSFGPLVYLLVRGRRDRTS
ncbi:MAG: DUF2834 domain-containing protein [Gemmatimonadaceae bacterium]|nr:DUF2834 domain-containing protein [Gemmatimonadaceae bacterium]